ncbi:MAG: asparagine synthase (glutamine-hydrolyzing) [Synechococcus sp.]
MCGLFGAVGLGNLPEAAIFQALQGRGPDDRGRWQAGPARLLHTRLAIQDLSPLGHQPMLRDGGGLALVFNGEIYNQTELRRELEAEGERFRSRSDTEVLVRGFGRWGNRLWSRLNGIFAVACWEVAAQRLTLARDGFGVKPLLWTRGPGHCAFGSELSAFEAAGLAHRDRLSQAALESYALWGAVAAPHTLLQGVDVFPAGHWGQWCPGGAWQLQAFASPLASGESTAAPAPEPAASPAERVAAALSQAVERQAIGDVPVGLFLSGGLDSGLLAALLRRSQSGPIRSVSVGFEGLPGAVDESELASLTARHLGLEHRTLRIGRSQLDGSFDAFLEAIDQPSIDGFNSFLVAAAARAEGMTVAFSGMGADELFGGYGHMVGLGRERLLRVRQIRCAGLSRSKRLRLRTQRADLLPAAAQRLAGGGVVPLRDASLLEVRGYLHDTLLRDGDAVTMHHGLELRVPFLDADLARLALSLDESSQRQGGAKGLLRQVAAPLLPETVLAGPKRGFNLALAPWLLEQPRFAPDRISRLLGRELAQRGLRAPTAAILQSWLLLRATRRWGAYWRWVVLAEWLQRA